MICVEVIFVSHAEPILDLCVSLPGREQSDCGFGRWTQQNLNITTTLRRQCDSCLDVFQEVHTLTVLHGQLKRHMALRWYRSEIVDVWMGEERERERKGWKGRENISIEPKAKLHWGVNKMAMLFEISVFGSHSWTVMRHDKDKCYSNWLRRLTCPMAVHWFRIAVAVAPSSNYAPLAP